MGFALIKEAVLDHLKAHKEGLRNADLARHLGLESDHEGQQKEYLTYSVLGLLLRECQVERIKRGAKTFYVRAVDVRP
jgi:hypothetical protein